MCEYTHSEGWERDPLLPVHPFPGECIENLEEIEYELSEMRPTLGPQRSPLPTLWCCCTSSLVWVRIGGIAVDGNSVIDTGCLKHQDEHPPFWCVECAQTSLTSLPAERPIATTASPEVAGKARKSGAPTSTDFQMELDPILKEAEQQDLSNVDIKAGYLHRTFGSYPGHNNRMPSCCNVMRKNMRSTDEVIYAPPKGNGANLLIRYRLPR